MDKKFKVFVIIAILALAVLAGTGTVVALSTVNSANNERSNESNESKQLTTFSLKETITANLAGDARKGSMVILSVGLGVDAKDRSFKEFNKQFDSNQLIIRDEIINIVRNQTYETMNKSDAQTQLGNQIKEGLNKLLDTEIIKEVYFGEFFVK